MSLDAEKSPNLKSKLLLSNLTLGDVDVALSLFEGPLIAHAVPHHQERVEPQRCVDHQLR